MNKATVVRMLAVTGSVAALGCAGEVDSEPGAQGAAGILREALTLNENSKFYVPPPNSAALDQIVTLIQKDKIADATRIAAMVTTPQAVWFSDGTPTQVKKAVKKTTTSAKSEKRVPVLVAYNLPYRDCAQYSAGGAVDTAAYQAWIDAFAEGIGTREAIVILEPDGLGIIPYNVTFWNAPEWCQPTVVDENGDTVPAPGASAEERYAQLRYAVAALAEKAPNASIYLDGTHSHWLGVGEAAFRLYKAGFDGSVPQVRGFFLNASNYQTTKHSTQFGTWVSMCLATGMVESIPDWYVESNPQSPNFGSPQFGWCAGQYRESEPGSGAYVVDYTKKYAASVTEGLLGLMAGVGASAATVPFVVDTSRNGRGALDAKKYAKSPYSQPESVITALNSGNWCNPPGAGLGLKPSGATGDPLVDAYLWIKVPGESDGSCDSAGGARAWDFVAYNPWEVAEADQAHFDPLWGVVDPAAGGWFDKQALELAKKADPALY